MLISVSYINMSLCLNYSDQERVTCMLFEFIHHPKMKTIIHSICCSIEISL